MATHDALREDVPWLLSGGRAHVGFQRAVADLPLIQFATSMSSPTRTTPSTKTAP